MEGQKIRIKLKAYEHAMLDRTTDDIVKTAKRTGARVIGPIPLPTRRSIYTVLRSPHVNKKSREQFEMRIHKRLIDLTHTTQQTIDDLTKLVLPAGVDIEIKTWVVAGAGLFKALGSEYSRYQTRCANEVAADLDRIPAKELAEL